MNIQVKSGPDGGPKIHIDQPCCSGMQAGLGSGFVQVGTPKKGAPHLAFLAPGTMLLFKVCPWCGQRPRIAPALNIVVPGMEVPPKLRGDGS